MHTTAAFKGAVRPAPSPVGVSDVPLPSQARDAPLPRSAPDGPEIRVAFPSESAPTRRVVGKQAPGFFRTAKLRGSGPSGAQALSAAAAALLSCPPVPFRTAAALLVSAPVLKDLAQALPARLGAGESSGYLLFGWYKHGGLTGVSSVTGMIPGVVQLLNALLAQAHPRGTWTTLGLFFSAVAGPHADRRNEKKSYNYILPLALPPSEQYMWVQRAVDGPLQPLAWLGTDGSVYSGFRLPLMVGQPACVDPHSTHALPAPLPHEAAAAHVLLVGFSVPWLHRATTEQWQQLQSLGFRLGLSRGGVSEVGWAEGEDFTKEPQKVFTEKISAATEQAGDVCRMDPGLLETCLIAEGHQHFQNSVEAGRGESSSIMQDVQEDRGSGEYYGPGHLCAKT